jgi:hypothetical protein
VETMTFWAEYHGGFKGFSPNEFFEWEDSHPLCSNTLSPSGRVQRDDNNNNIINHWSIPKNAKTQKHKL